MSSLNEFSDVNEYVISLRRYFHENPELSFKEFRTAEKIEAELKSMGLEPKRLAGTGVIADIEGDSPGKTVAVRADIDALPVEEENKFEFVSKNKGVMHACGHDAHIAMALGLAKILSQNREKIRGRVRMLFQPAEEQPPGGAVELIKNGALEGVDYVIGQHVMSSLPAGKVAVYYNVLMANSDKFTVRIHGKGGHGSAPHEAVDALMVASHFVVAVQTIVSRRIDPLKAAVVTVGTMHSGFRFNIIAPHAELTGTVRTLDNDTKELVKQELRKLLEGLCLGMNATFEFEYEEGYPLVVNNPDVARIVEESVSEVMGKDAVLHPDPVMGGEDFGYYMKKVPGAFYFWGLETSLKG